MKDSNSKYKLYAVILTAVSAVIVFALALVIVFVKRDDGRRGMQLARLTTLSVNGVEATADGDDYSVRIPQCATARIEYTCEQDVECRFFTSDGVELDIGSVPIGGKDVVLGYSLDAGGASGALTLYNVIPDADGLTVTVNGASPSAADGTLVFALPPHTRAFTFDEIATAEFFAYKLFTDADKTTELTDISAPPMQSRFYLDVYNVNSADVYKSYVINIDILPSADDGLTEVSVNGTTATRSGDTYAVAVNKTAFLDISAAASDDGATVELFKDGTRIDGAHLRIDERVAEHMFTVRVTAASGRTKDYGLTVSLIYDADARIEQATVNGVRCHIDGTALYVLLDRTDRLSVSLQTASVLATARLYGDSALQNEIADMQNIDARHSGATLGLYAAVAAENGDMRMYTLNISFTPSADCALYTLSVNGKPTVFESGAARVDVLGTDAAQLRITDIAASEYASVKAYADAAQQVELTDLAHMTVAAASPYVYIVVTAEDGQHASTYTLELRFISDDNTLKSITVNGTEYVITGEQADFYIESCAAISVDGMEHADSAQISVYYDAMQTEPVPDLSDIRRTDKTAELYVRVVAQSSDIRVFRIRLTVKDAPTAVFAAGVVKLNDWQETLDISSLVRIDGNSYLPEQYAVTVYWNGAAQSSDRIRVENVARIYELRVRISGPYFKTYDFERQIRVEPYVLTPVTATLVTDRIEIADAPAAVAADRLVAIDCGSYVLGKHFYIAVYKPDGTEIVTDLAQTVSLSAGTVSIGVCALGGLFDNYTLGDIAVTETVLAPPAVTSADCYEYTPSGDTLDVRDLFTVAENGNKILSVSVYIDGAAADTLTLTEGVYGVRVTVLYGGGTAERTFTVRVMAVSDNTNATVYVNGAAVKISDDGACAAELAYDATADITAETESAKAMAELTVNGTVVPFGRVALDTGANTLVITVTAENGDTRRYTLVITKRARALPQIATTDKTVKLTENQAYVSVADCYTLTANDYAVTAALFCDGNRLYGDILPVTDRSRTYTVTVRTEGECAVEATFRVGVIGYSAVKISFKFGAIDCADGYVFTQSDFVESVTFIGYAEPHAYDVLLNGAPLADGRLDAGQYTVTVRAYAGGALVVEQSALFIVTHDGAERAVHVSLKRNAVAIAEETATLDFADVFEADYGAYAEDECDVYYIIGGRKTYDLRVTAGANTITVVVEHAATAAELYSQTFTLDCKYKPASQNVFASVRINGAPVQVCGDRVTIVSDTPPTYAELEYTLQSGFMADGLLPRYELTRGVNYIGYTAVKNGARIECVLEIYNVYTLAGYITGIEYDGHAAADYKIVAASGAFDPSKLRVALSDSRVTTEQTYDRAAANVYDVTVRGRYDDIDIGYETVRVFMGAAQPMLTEVLFDVIDDSVIACGIHGFTADVVCVTDDTALAPVFDAVSDRYEIACALTGLNVGHNSRTLTATDAQTGARYEYEVEITVFPTNAVSRVAYCGVALSAKNGVYVADATSIERAGIEYELDARLADVALECESKAVLFNGVTVGYDHALVYDRVKVFGFSVAARSDNVSVVVECDGAELAQSGNAEFVYGLSVDKATRDGRIVMRFDISALYPYTTVAGEHVEQGGDGYRITLDAGEVSALEIGTHTLTERFTAVSLDRAFEYIISVELIVTQTDAADAPLVITVDGTQDIIFGESDLDGAFAVAGKPLRVSIFRSEITLTISGYKMYNFVENGVAKDSITLPVVYFGYLEFDVENDLGIKHVRIFCECKDADGNDVETGIVVAGKELYITENAPVTTVVYNGTVYDDVLVASGTAELPAGTEQVSVELYGELADTDSFAFADGTVGRSGLLQVQGGRILVIMDDYGTLVPYAVIEIITI